MVNGFARNVDASSARDAIFLGNTVGFALSTITLVLGLVGGAPAPVWGIATVIFTTKTPRHEGHKDKNHFLVFLVSL